MKVLLTWLVVVIAAFGTAGPAAAYVGPGAGLSLVGAFWGLLVAIFAAVAFIVVWPVRRLLRRNRSAPDMPPKVADPGKAPEPAPAAPPESTARHTNCQRAIVDLPAPDPSSPAS